MTIRTESAPPAVRTAGTLRAVQATAVLSVLALLWQFVTAGQLVDHSHDALDAHAAGAVVLHVVSALLAVATVLHTRAGGARWPVAVAVAVLLAGFVQAALGDAGNMGAHVPGALVLTVGIVWITAWAFRRRPPA